MQKQTWTLVKLATDYFAVPMLKERNTPPGKSESLTEFLEPNHVANMLHAFAVWSGMLYKEQFLSGTTLLIYRRKCTHAIYS